MAGKPRSIRFGPFEYDFEEDVLRRDGVPVALQPQPTAVLRLLLEEPGRLVTRDELQERVWGDRVVEFDAGLNFSIAQVRRALEDDARKPRYLQTVHRRGYRLVDAGAVESVGRASSEEGWSWRWLTAALMGGAALTAAGAAIGRTAHDGANVALTEPLALTFDAGRWLYEQREYERSLVRLDSVRLGAPDFAPAWTLTANAQLRLRRYPAARRSAERALALDPRDGEAYSALGQALFFEVESVGALEAFERAVDLDPDEPRYRQWYAQALANRLRLEEAIAQLEEIRRRDPVSNLVGVDLAAVYLAAGRYRDAVTHCTNARDLVPQAAEWTSDCLMTASHFLGDGRAALGHARDLMTRGGAGTSTLDATTDLDDYFLWDIERLLAQGRDGEPDTFRIARAWARLGDTAAALDAIRRLRALRHHALQWLPRDPWFRILHGDPEFEAILREAGLPTPGG